MSVRAIAAVLIAAAAASCASSGGDESGVGGPPTARSVHEQLVRGSCGLSSSCHDANGHKARLDLSTVESMCASLKGAPSCEKPSMKRVVPGRPSDSYLLRKVKCAGIDCTPDVGEADPACADALSNGRMPLNGAPLAANDVQTLEAWIAGGLAGCP